MQHSKVQALSAAALWVLGTAQGLGTPEARPAPDLRGGPPGATVDVIAQTAVDPVAAQHSRAHAQRFSSPPALAGQRDVGFMCPKNSVLGLRDHVTPIRQAQAAFYCAESGAVYSATAVWGSLGAVWSGARTAAGEGTAVAIFVPAPGIGSPWTNSIEIHGEN